MPKKMLTDLFCERVKPPPEGRIEYFDGACRQLVLRVTAAGHKSFSAYYRFGGKNRRYTIGSYPAVKPAEARRAVGELLHRLDSGVDPSAEKRARRDASSPDIDLFADLVRDYLELYASKNTSAGTYAETKRALERDVVSKWGKRPIGSITRSDVHKLVDAIAAGGAPVQANRTLAHIGKVFNWAVGKGRMEKSPAAGAKPPVKELPRDRVLTDDELRWLWLACDEKGPPFGLIVRLLMLTAQRRDEVGGMKWSELELDKGLWTIPRGRAKNGRAHIVHLSEPATALLHTIERRDGVDLVFPSRGEGPVSGFSRAKDLMDAGMVSARRRELGLPEDDEAYRRALKLPAGKPLPVEIPEWIFHDMRRTAATGMARLAVPPHVVDKILNHVSGTIRGVAAVYNRFEYLEERRSALEAWGRFISSLITPAPANVVPLRAAR